MIDMARWKQLKRGPRPFGVLSVKDSEKEVTDKDLDQIEKRLNRKLSDGELDERVIAVGKEVDTSQNTSPADMDYVSSFEQMGEAILAIHGIGKAFVGLTGNMTYGSNAAAHQMAMTVVQSDLDLLAGEWTQLAQDEGEAVAVEYEVQPIDDPTLVEQQLTTDLAAGIRTVRELRAIRGLPPLGDHRDDMRVTSTGFVDDSKPPKPPAAEPLFRMRNAAPLKNPECLRGKNLPNGRSPGATISQRRAMQHFELPTSAGQPGR